MAPWDASSGELSNALSMIDPGATIWPLSPSARQKGSSYMTCTLVTAPIGMRWQSWSRRPGSAGQ